MSQSILLDTGSGNPKAIATGTAAGALNVALASDTSTALVRTTLLAAVTATGAGSAVADSGRAPSFTATVAGTGAVSATVLIQARNTASGEWILLATITLSGTTTASDGFAQTVRYMEYRANLTARSGTGAAVTVTMGS